MYQKTAVGENSIFKKLKSKTLKLNTNKSVFVDFSINNTYIPFDEFVIHHCNSFDVNSELCNCQKITRITRVKYLGLVIDWHLRWNLHIIEYLFM